MLIKAKQHLLNNLSLKILSLIIAYMLWAILSADHRTELTLRVPLSFYNAHGYVIDAPETVSIKLSAPRKELYFLSRKLAAHIDIASLELGKQNIIFDNSLLFLPDTVTLLRCSPTPCTIDIKKA